MEEKRLRIKSPLHKCNTITINNLKGNLMSVKYVTNLTNGKVYLRGEKYVVSVGGVIPVPAEETDNDEFADAIRRGWISLSNGEPSQDQIPVVDVPKVEFETPAINGSDTPPNAPEPTPIPGAPEAEVVEAVETTPAEETAAEEAPVKKPSKKAG